MCLGIPVGKRDLKEIDFLCTAQKGAVDDLLRHYGLADNIALIIRWDSPTPSCGDPPQLAASRVTSRNARFPRADWLRSIFLCLIPSLLQV